MSLNLWRLSNCILWNNYRDDTVCTPVNTTCPQPSPSRKRKRSLSKGTGKKTVNQKLDKKFSCKTRRGMTCAVDTAWHKRGFNSLTGIWIFLNVYCLYRKWFLSMPVFIVRVWRNIRSLYKNWWFSFHSNKMTLKFTKNIFFFYSTYIFYEQVNIRKESTKDSSWSQDLWNLPLVETESSWHPS